MIEIKQFVRLDKIGRRIGVVFTLNDIQNAPLLKEKLNALEPEESILITGKNILKRVI